MQAPVQRVNIEMLLPAYDGFIDQCKKSSREYVVLKTE
jgi:hypothetical protein